MKSKKGREALAPDISLLGTLSRVKRLSISDFAYMGSDQSRPDRIRPKCEVIGTRKNRDRIYDEGEPIRGDALFHLVLFLTYFTAEYSDIIFIYDD